MLRGEQDHDLLIGNSGSDTLYGDVGNDTLQGGADADSLYGDAGNDVLSGEAGSDYLNGGVGNDTYLFGRGDGSDVILDSDTTAGNLDTVQFKAGVKSTDVLVRRWGADLVLSIKGAPDWITVSGFFDGGNSRQIEAVRFTDEPGVTWDVAKLIKDVSFGTDAAEQVWGSFGDDTISGGLGNDSVFGESGNDAVNGNDGNDNLYGWWGNDTLDGGAGNDLLRGEQDNDLLIGNSGSDTLYGDVGNDTLQGGADNDRLDGGLGNDVYQFSGAFGRDTVSNNDTVAGKTDVIEFGSSFPSKTYWFSRNGSDLTIQDDQAGTNAVTLEGLFDEHGVRSTHINLVKFADGTTWDRAFLKQLVLSANGTVSGFSSDDLVRGLANNDILYGNAGNDTLSGGAGTDTLEGGIGNDTYLFGRGDGVDLIRENDATAANTDRLMFEGAITHDQLWFSQAGSNLKISVIGTTDSVTISNWSSGAAHQVEQITAGGKSLSHTQVSNLVQAMAGMAAPAANQTSLSDAQRTQLAPVLAASWG